MKTTKLRTKKVTQSMVMTGTFSNVYNKRHSVQEKGDGCLTSIGELIITILYIIKCMHVDLFLRPNSYVKICQLKYTFPIQTNFNNSPFMAKTHSLSLMLKDYYDGDRKISGKVDRRDRYFTSF